jgi:hypothetical protein
MGSVLVSDEDDTDAGALPEDTSPSVSAAGPRRVGNKLPTLQKAEWVQTFLEIA